MKNKMKKGLAFLLSFVMVLALTGVQAPVTAKAAEEISFSCTTKSVAIGGTYTLTVDGITDTKATYSWSSSNSNVAVVSSKGMITGIAAGSATIKCKITMSDDSTKTLSCKVTVKEHTPAESIAISNAKCDTINAHILKVGETYDFNRTLIPATSNDKTYWYVQDENYAEVDGSGIVTAKKEGITMLVAQAGIDRVDAELPTNMVVDYVYLYIVSADAPQSTPTRPTTPTITVTPTPTVPPVMTVTPTPTIAPTEIITPSPAPTVTEAPVYGEAAVTRVSLLSFDELQILFGQPVEKSTVVKTNGTLTECIDIVGRSNALDYGELTGELSEDGMTLILRASNGFDGIYQVSVNSGIKTIKGGMIANYSEQKRLSDNANPYYVETKIDEKGYINTIYFSEPIDITNLEIVGAENCGSDTADLLRHVGNYTLADDKKSMSIDLGGIDYADENKNLVVVMNGICDKAGNFTSPYSLRITLCADTKFRAVANLLSIERISLTEVVATFDGMLIDAGELTVGSYTVPGEVDIENEYKAIYQLNESQQKLTGKQAVLVNKWYSYYATGAANNTKQYIVDFTPSVASPVLEDTKISQSTEENIVTTKITLVYDKNIHLLKSTGTLQVTLAGNNGYIIPMDVMYTAKEDGNKIIITIDDSQMSTSGEYTITIPSYFCADTYYNYTAEKMITVKVDVEQSAIKLAAPYEIVQDSNDANKIYVKFSSMLDKVSAQTIQNYVINSATPVSATLIEQTENGATVCLTLPAKAIQYTGTYPIQIKNVKGYSNVMNKMDTYKTMITLVENTPPVVASAKLISSDEVVLTFRESSQLQGYADFAVYLPGTTKDIANYAYIADDNTVHIELSSVTSGQVVVEPTTFCELRDENGNKAVLQKSYTATKGY